MAKIAKRHIGTIEEDMLSSQLAIKVNSSGNANITIASSLAEITAAGAGAIVEIREPITLTANYQIPIGQQWLFTTGYVDIDNYELNFNGASLNFSPKRKGLDLTNGTVVGEVLLLNDKLFASNIGAIDDNTLDNFNAIKNAMHIVNQNSNTFYFDKQTAINTYYLRVYNDDHSTPFFINGHGGNVILIGNGYNNVTVTGDGGTKIKSYAANESGSAIFVLYNTTNSKVSGLHFIGDRDEHLYEQRIRINNAVGATSNGILTFRILEFADFNDNAVTKTTTENINITTGNQVSVANEIVTQLNNSVTFLAAGYVARVALETETPITDTDERVIITLPAGTYGGTRVDGDTSGAGITADSMLYEWGHCLVIDSMANFCDIGNNFIEKFHGDGIAKSDQGNGTSNINGVDHMTNGFIDENGTITAGGGYYYMTNTRPLPGPHNWFQMTPTITSSVYLQHFKYWIAYYDDLDNFVEKSGTLTPYDIYEYPSDKFKRYRFIVEDNGEMTNTAVSTWFIDSPSAQKGGVIHDNVFKDNRRHAMTNVINHMIVERNHFYRNSGVSPEIDLNIEDWGKRVSGQIVRNNVFTLTNVANISIKGCNRVEIYGNRFEQGAYTLNSGAWDAKSPAILTSFARNTQIHGNFFESKSGYVDILTNSHNNTYTNSVLGIRSGSATVHHETFINSIIGDGTIGGVVTEGIGGAAPSHFEDSKFYINDGWGNTAFLNEANTLHHKNIRYYFNEAAKASNHAALLDESLRWVYWNSTSSNYLRANKATNPNGEHEGTYDGIYVYGAKVEPSMLQRVGWAQYAAPTKNFYFESSLDIQNGYEKSFTIKDGTIKGWFRLSLGEYPTDGIGNFQTIEIKDVVVEVPQRTTPTAGYLNNTFYGGGIPNTNLFRTATDVNVNLVFKNCKFISKDDTIGLFMYLGNRGTTTFIDCTFDAPNAENVDFTSTGLGGTVGVYAGANHGIITITNPTTPGNRITFTGATIN